MTRYGGSAALVSILLIVAACGSDDGSSRSVESPDVEPTVAASAAQVTETTVIEDTTRSSSSAAPGEIGITEDEARETGVLTGQYDALLVGPQSAVENEQGCLEISLELRNVGGSDDSYRVSASAEVTGIDPPELSLVSGEAGSIVVTVCDRSATGFVVEVESAGLGDLVAQLEV